MSLTTDPQDAGLLALRPDGQQEKYLVLSEEERTMGFIRQVRRSYRHVRFSGPTYPLRDVTDDEKTRYGDHGYVKYEEYPADTGALVGRYWTEDQLADVGRTCDSVTTMGQALAETYARSPQFYSGTFCVACARHFPLRTADGQPAFVWLDDKTPVGS